MRGLKLDDLLLGAGLLAIGAACFLAWGMAAAVGYFGVLCLIFGYLIGVRA